MPPPDPTAFEKLGQFYLGRVFDTRARARTDDLLLYDARDLVTHAVCVGMTGSGKTGLCLALLEEAAIDGVPAIIIDPKGDLGNLLLTFPNLSPADFRPWINEDDARRKAMTPDDYAADQAGRWKAGLADWGQSGERIAKLRQSADFRIYTPGSSSGVPVSVLRSFDAPPMEIIEDAEAFRERVSGCATSLLGLAGVSGDAMQSREHILVSAILTDAWGKGETLDLPTLIARVQTPPFTKMGVMELENVYPGKERFGLAMALNNLVAAPGFAAWTTGQPLDLGAMLFTPDGRPRHAIFSIAHLSDAERMFFVSLLLNQTLAWVRTQSGTTSLRALLYMDEIAGYAPPSANPPSKWPLLTLMKQARAQGLGVVLATQNPVDLDYKGLSNAGTWFIGRLQTERDKLRVLDGLEGALGGREGWSRDALDSMISGLQSRVFLMNNVHEDGPVTFETRWCLSYLRGPLTRPQIKTLMNGPGAAAPASSASAAHSPPSHPGVQAPASSGSRPHSAPASSRPVLPSEIPQYFLPARAGAAATYRPMLLACATVTYTDTKLNLSAEQPVNWLVPFGDGPVVVDWDHAQDTPLTDRQVAREGTPSASFGPVPPAAAKPKSYDDWTRAFADAVLRSATMRLFRCASLKVASTPGETEAAFRQRLSLTARERRDEAVAKLRAKFAPRMATLEDRLRRAEQALQKQKEQASAAKLNTGVSIGSAIFGALFGRKSVSMASASRVASAARSGSRAVQEAKDVARAGETVEAVRAQIAELQSQFDDEVSAIARELDPVSEPLEEIDVRPKKTGIQVRCVLLAWAPHLADGRPAW